MSANHEFDVDGLDREVTVQHVVGVEGPSVYVNGLRIAGPKPWGGGTVDHTCVTTVRDLLEAVLGRDATTVTVDDELRRLAGTDAYGYHTEHRRRQTPLLLAALTKLAAEGPP